MAQFLIQEDDSEFAHQLTLALSTQNHQSIVCFDSDQSIAYLNEQPVDAVIADIFVREGGVLKPRGGLYLLGVLQQSRLRGHELGNLPVMVMTGTPRSETGIDVLDQAVAMGAVCTLRKPFAISKFLDSANSMLPTSKR